MVTGGNFPSAPEAKRELALAYHAVALMPTIWTNNSICNLGSANTCSP